MIKVLGFDGREYKMNLDKVVRQYTPPSSYHQKAIDILTTICPSARYYSEVTLLGCKGVEGRELCADIFVPSFMAIIEIHGEQHYKYVKHFHKSIDGFHKYVRNDQKKKEWCELNDISYIELKYDQQDKWEDLIYDGINS
jgi:hypothetical protein